MGEWTAELERLFKQKEYEYWEEQRDQYAENQIDYEGREGDLLGAPDLRGTKEWDKIFQWFHDQADAALDKDIQRSGERDGEILVEDLEAEATRKEREQKALKQLQDELDKADQDAEKEKKDKEEKEKKDKEEGAKKKEEQESSDDDDDDDGDGEDGQASAEASGSAQPEGMPTEGDDYVGVVRKFWGGNGSIDPTDTPDTRRAIQLIGGDAPIEPWDSYDGIGSDTHMIYGGDEPTPAWERIGPKF